MEMKKTPERESELSWPEAVFANQIREIDKGLDIIAGYISEFEVELNRLKVNRDTTRLLQHIIDQKDEPVSRKRGETQESAYYSTIRSNRKYFEFRLRELEEVKKVLFKMQNGNIVDNLPKVVQLLHDDLVPLEKGKMDVVTFLIEDLLEIIEILEKALEEIQEFEAICRLVQSLPEAKLDKIQNA